MKGILPEEKIYGARLARAMKPLAGFSGREIHDFCRSLYKGLGEGEKDAAAYAGATDIRPRLPIPSSIPHRILAD